MTRILVVGSGAREHALAVALARGPGTIRLFLAPGNAGTESLGERVVLDDDSPAALVRAAQSIEADLVVIGPEAPLVAGAADALREAGIDCFGPGARGARLEGSKAHAKEFLRRHHIPTADFRVFESHPHARSYVGQCSGTCVVKADGLASGKGVYVTSGPEEADRALHELMVERKLGEAGMRVVVEDRLEGVEASLFLVMNGTEALALPLARDFKRLLDGDRGPNTGGMGAAVPHPLGSPAVWRKLDSQIVRPLLEALRAEEIDYRGLLYVGLMLTEQGPMVLEFNCRFGDPETQPLVVQCPGPWLPTLQAAARGEPMPPLAALEGITVCRVLAGEEYPGAGRARIALSGLEDASRVAGVELFHAGTTRVSEVIMGGPGRMLSLCAHGDSLDAAAARLDEATARLHAPGAQWRTDLAARLAEVPRPPKAPPRVLPEQRARRPVAAGAAPRREGFARPERGGSDRPRREFDRPRTGADRPRRESDRPRTGPDRPRRESDRPRTGPDRPRRESDRARTGPDRPRRDFDRPRTGSDRPHRPTTPGGPARPAGGGYARGGDRRPRAGGSARPESSRPYRDRAGRPPGADDRRPPRREGGSVEPRRPFKPGGPRPEYRPRRDAGRPPGPRREGGPRRESGSVEPRRSSRPAGARPEYRPRPDSARPAGARREDRPRSGGARPASRPFRKGPRIPSGPRGSSTRPAGSAPRGDSRPRQGGPPRSGPPRSGPPRSGPPRGRKPPPPRRTR